MSMSQALLLLSMMVADEGSRACFQVREIEVVLVDQALELYKKGRARPRRQARRLLAEARELAEWRAGFRCAGQVPPDRGEGTKKALEAPTPAPPAKVVYKSAWPFRSDQDEPSGPDVTWRSAQEVATLSGRNKTLWGADGRRAPSGPTEARVAAATVALVATERMTQKRGLWVVEGVKTLRETEGDLCEGEKFQDEPVVSICSGVLVDREWVATAKHCLPSDPKEVKLVFGFGDRGPPKMTRGAGAARVEFAAASVFGVVEWKQGQAWEDWALLRLDRPATVAPVQVATTRVRDDQAEELAISGYPRGLPLKYSAGARVIAVGEYEDEAIFHASLDAYQGNSGSPVVMHDNGLLVGLLSAGSPDFVRDASGCTRSMVCTRDLYCPGERVQRVDGGFAAALEGLRRGDFKRQDTGKGSKEGGER